MGSMPRLSKRTWNGSSPNWHNSVFSTPQPMPDLEFQQASPSRSYPSPPTYAVYGVCFDSDFAFRTPLPRVTGKPSFRYLCRADRYRVPVPAPEIYRSRRVATDGTPSLILRQHGDTIAFCLPDGTHLVLRPDQIEAYAADERQQTMAEICLLGTVLSYLREREGIPVLHASVVAVEGKGVAFLAGNGGGKSSLAAALMQKGYPLVSDDLLPILTHSGRYVAAAGYPQMRFWPQEARFFVDESNKLERVHPDLEKRRVPVGLHGFGSFCAHALPLSAIYLPERHPAAELQARVEIVPVPPREALVALTSQLFIRPLLAEFGWLGERLRFLAQLTQCIPVRRLRYPSGMSRLGDVVERILEDLGHDPHPGSPSPT